mmetsp:Transcript_19993/g.47736  ORF Transcript_19993/g.47736 Transcript_19993/m.47736 type:complete len:190 (-) Transcript_19993:781-1350(-)
MKNNAHIFFDNRLGANSAMEDVRILSDVIDQVSAMPESSGSSYKSVNIIPDAVKLFSKRRSGDAQALVTMSRNLDRPGKMFFVTFLAPLILDGMFHKLAPKLFGPNMFEMFAKDLSFQQIQRKKRLDRGMQLAAIGTVLACLGAATKVMVRQVARWTGQSQAVVSLAAILLAVTSKLLLDANKKKTEVA